jgi:cytochrome subunit of sulfide dehydrogenase
MRAAPPATVNATTTAWPRAWALALIASTPGLTQAQAQAQGPDPLLARNLAATCANCHGTNGQATNAIKPLAGLPADRLLAVLADFRSGTQTATVMHQIAKGYSDDQLRLIAGYFAAQKARP